MRYTYYPGCSLHSTAKEYDISLKAVCSILGIELIEPKNWICCGSSPGHAVSKLLGVSLPYQNFVIMENLENKEVIVPCSACFSRFKTAQFEFKNDNELLRKVEEIVGKRLTNELEVLHPLAVFSQETILNKIKMNLKKDLAKLKIVCYYGCLLTRPPKVMEFDECEYPQSMDKILEFLGIQTLDWSYKTDCCGASFSLTITDIVHKLCHKILKEAKSVGADGISVACPLCHANLDMRQKEIEKEYNEEFNLPIFYFTQLIGFSMDISYKKLGLKKHIVSPEKLLKNG